MVNPSIDLYEKQKANELESTEIGVDSYRKALLKARQSGDVEKMAPEAKMIRMYMNPLLRGDGKTTGLIHIIRGNGQKKIRRHAIARQYLDTVAPMELGFITLREVFNSIQTPSTPVVALAKRIGTAVNDHIGYLNFKKENPDYFKNVVHYVRMKSDSQKRIVIKNRAKHSQRPSKWLRHEDTKKFLES